MVKKLIKYDFAAFAKVMLPVEAGVLLVALLYRIMQFFENESEAYAIFNGSMIVVLVVSFIAAMLISFIFSIVRFYKNFFTAEGYLSFTLPVTETSHIVSKLVVSLIFDIITVITILLSLCIATAGDVLVEVLKAAGYLFGKGYANIGVNLPLFILEFILASLLSLIASHALVFLCISIGQTAKKHKILAAVGIYFIIYIIMQMAGTVVITVGALGGLFEELSELFERSPMMMTHIAFFIAIVIQILLFIIYFFVTRHMIKNKLNLE